MALDRIKGTEKFFSDNEIIVSKTNLQGKVTYCNDVFMRISGYYESEIIGKPHNLIRHPDMPRSVFKLLWDELEIGNEIFAYVINKCKNGDYYWVFAHLTPDQDEHGTTIGYHSNRRVPERNAVSAIAPLYAQLRAEEERHSNIKDAINASAGLLNSLISAKGGNYAQFVLSL